MAPGLATISPWDAHKAMHNPRSQDWPTMQLIEGRPVYAASDINNFLECAHLTRLDRSVMLGEQAPPQDIDPSRELLARKGQEFEQRYRQSLEIRTAHRVTAFERPAHSIAGFEAAQAQTLAAMDRGDALIYQATFFDGTFLGHPDFLRRVEVPSERRPWSYEVIDTKLALQAKPYFIIQLCNYSEHLARLNGSIPEFAYVVLGNGEEQRFRLSDFAAYYRHIKKRFTDCVAQRAPDSYPDKCSHCKTCKWQSVCAARRDADDHLSLVAAMRRDQISRLNDAGISTVQELAAAGDAQRPNAMNSGTFTKLRRQAAMQVRGRNEGPVYQLIDHEPWQGFGLLPQPDEHDVFFDMEGDPLYEPGRGLEYLFGMWSAGQYNAFWARDRSQERRAFEDVVDRIIGHRRAHPRMHVYHYADYEKSALRRLAQVYGTREQEVDDLLRGEVLVDLFAVVRQSLVISEDSYSIKRLEKFYQLHRLTAVKKGDDSIVMFEQWLADPAKTEILADIERYNEDDCRSTQLLRDWLLERRKEAIDQRGADIPFHEAKLQCHPLPVDGCRRCAERVKSELEAKHTTEQQQRLLAGILPPQTELQYQSMREDHRARYLLANLLAYHRREEKPVWWAFFDRCDNADRLLEFDKDAIAGLQLCPDVEPARDARSFLYTYSFPDQQYKLAVGDAVVDPATGQSAGTIFQLDDVENRLTLKSGCSLEQAQKVVALIPGGPHPTGAQKAALARLAQAYIDGELPRATLDLLLSRDPRVRLPAPVQPHPVNAENVSAVARALDESYLFIQGPPGSGKTTIASTVICDLLQAGKRLGVLSNSHKAIHNLLHKVEACALERGKRFTGRYKYTKGNGDSKYESKILDSMIATSDKNEDFEKNDVDLIAGTAFLFSREGLSNTLDYLFIDEAGQISLADAIAVSAAARNIVLLGDPLQLAQVSQGTHPLRAGDSVLQHLLNQAPTVPDTRGVFLDVSYRMHPEICGFISNSVYAGRLHSAACTIQQAITGEGLSGSGLRFLPVEHTGNSRESSEEAQRLVQECALLLQSSLTDQRGCTRPVLERDIIIVTPYNAQRRLITKMLQRSGLNIRVGTVDKFQGQEAFVVFYSMATSSGKDMPRDMTFLFEPNRFNVAISRARALSVLMCSPSLLDVSCRTTQAMASVNLLCAFAEQAQRAEGVSQIVGTPSLRTQPERSIVKVEAAPCSSRYSSPSSPS